MKIKISGGLFTADRTVTHADLTEAYPRDWNLVREVLSALQSERRWDDHHKVTAAAVAATSDPAKFHEDAHEALAEWHAELGHEECECPFCLKFRGPLDR